MEITFTIFGLGIAGVSLAAIIWSIAFPGAKTVASDKIPALDPNLGLSADFHTVRYSAGTWYFGLGTN